MNVSVQDRRLIKAGGKEAIINLADKERVSRVGALLVGLFKDLAIREQPSAYDGTRMLAFIELNHPRFTTADVKEAFEFFLAGRLAEYLPEKHDHYQQFSVAFYAKIFRAYAQLQSQARHNVRLKVQTKQIALQAPTDAPEVSEYRSLQIIRRELANAVASGQLHFTLPGFTHDLFVRLRICRIVEQPTTDELSAAAHRLKVKKGAGMAFTWAMQRILAGEKVNDVEWEAMTEKRLRWMAEDIEGKGEEAIDILDAHIRALKARAAEKSINLEAAA